MGGIAAGKEMKKMKKLFSLLLPLALALLLAACAQEMPTNDTHEPPEGADTDELIDSGAAELKLRVVDGAESGTLVLAGKRAGDVYTLVLTDEIPLYLDGERIQSADVEDGMTACVRFTGGIQETFPARPGGVADISFAREVGESGVYDLCGLYLRVLEDLWEKDSGLNADAALISVDLSGAPKGLTDGEKEAIAWVFASLHGAESLSLSYEELKAQGYLVEDKMENGNSLWHFENGLLFTISSSDEDAGNTTVPLVCFNAEKWRTPLGAYALNACIATCTEDGRWNGYSIGAELIS